MIFLGSIQTKRSMFYKTESLEKSEAFLSVEGAANSFGSFRGLNAITGAHGIFF